MLKKRFLESLGSFWGDLTALTKNFKRQQSRCSQFSFGSIGEGVTFGLNFQVIGNSNNVFLGKNVRVGDDVRIVITDDDSKVIIGEGTVLQPRVILETGPSGSIELGRLNTVNPYCVIYGHGGLTTGEYVRIATHTVIIPANHIYEDPAVPIARQGLTKMGVRIGNDVWIGCGCRILDGVEIGSGSVLAAGSVVHRNVEPYSVVGGVPAKRIKWRKSSISSMND